MKVSALLAATSTCLLACTSAWAATPTGAPSAPRGQSLANHNLALYGGFNGYAHSYTPTGAFHFQEHRRAIQSLAAKVRSLTGKDAAHACRGFRTVGDCVAAAHVSSNLNVSFTTVREQMTGQNRQPLSSVIGNLRPAADSQAEAAKAFQQARDDVSKT
jgi:hypothetical protein